MKKKEKQNKTKLKTPVNALRHSITSNGWMFTNYVIFLFSFDSLTNNLKQMTMTVKIK